MYCDVCNTLPAEANPCGHTVCVECKRTSYCQACVLDRLWTKRYGRRRPRAIILPLGVRPSIHKKRSVNAYNESAETSISSLESVCPEALDGSRRKGVDGRNTLDIGNRRPDEEGHSGAESELACGGLVGTGRNMGGAQLVQRKSCTPEICEERTVPVSEDTELSRLDVTVNNVEVEVYDPLLYIPAAGIGSVK